MAISFVPVLCVFVGLAGGLVVGAGFVAFLIVLDLIPRLVQISRSSKWLPLYEVAVVSGALCWTLLDFFGWNVRFFSLGSVFIGLLAGIFVGMLAAALTEVLNVLPILARRVGLNRYIVWLLAAMVLGKVTGSLYDWLIYHQA